MLLDALAERMSDEPLGPLEREVIVVQSRGMYRWVTLGLARKLGIAATLATPYPGTFCRALAERLAGSRAVAPSERYEPEEGSPYERDALAWRIFGLLGAGATDIAGPAAPYLADDPDQQKRYQLAVRLAGRFDEYLLYRADVLLAWERGEQPVLDPDRAQTAAWQAALWRAIVAGAGKDHPARRLTDLAARLQRGKSFAALPPRVSVFGASSLPPLFLEVLAALARRCPVTIYTVNPSNEYWADIRSERAAAKQLDLFRERGLPGEYAHVETGNPLLASLGEQGRDLNELLNGLDAEGSAWRDLEYVTPKHKSVLGTLQADVVELIDRGAADVPACPLPARDHSLEVHVCHSRTREMEVLRDVILDAFANDSALRPHDVFVLAPDIAAYAPYVEAVFGVAHGDEPQIPFTIADRSARTVEPAIDGALCILEMVGARATATSVVDLLDVAAIRRAAGLGAGEVATVRDWVRTTNIRWGIDAEHRRSGLGLPSEGADTWRAGLDRLLMGYAAGNADALIAGIVPSRAAIAGESDLLGRFVTFADSLFGELRRLGARRTLDRWARDIRAAFVRLLAPDDELEHEALRSLLDHVDALEQAHAGAAVAEPVDMEVVRAHLAARLDEEAGGAGFLTGGVTFCSLKPMRAIPAKLVCIVGLGDGAFPRLDRRPTFDLMSAEHHKGDRSPRSDDRYLFLETLLAARERLVITYVGKSQKDNSDLAPSIVLAELLDHLDQTFTARDGRLAREHVTTLHALQPFSESYFGQDAARAQTDARRFSYSKENCKAALAARTTPPRIAQLCPAPLPALEGRLEIPLGDLIAFWVNPSKFFCRNVLGVRFPWEEGEIEDSEPFALDGLAQYGLVDRLAARRLGGEPEGEDELALLQAGGDLPHGGFARAHYEGLRTTVAGFTAAVAAVAGDRLRELRSEAVEIEGEHWRVFGTLELNGQCVLRCRPATLKAKDKLRAWIAHVVLNAWRDTRQDRERAPLPRTTVLVGLDKTLRWGPLANARATLEQLVEGYREGRRRPLPVFAIASCAFAERTRKDAASTRPKGNALSAARKEFEGEEGYGNEDRKKFGDLDDPHVALCTRDRDPFIEDVEEFQARALALWDPVLSTMEEIER